MNNKKYTYGRRRIYRVYRKILMNILKKLFNKNKLRTHVYETSVHNLSTVK